MREERVAVKESGDCVSFRKTGMFAPRQTGPEFRMFSFQYGDGEMGPNEKGNQIHTKKINDGEKLLKIFKSNVLMK